MQGWAAVGLGISIVALVFTTVAPDPLGGILVAFALAMYLLAVIFFLLSTWLSRRPAG
jgi:hypothetical protein